MTDDSETILRVARDEALARDWELVLLAQGLSPRIRRTLDGIVLAVPLHEADKALAGLAAYEKETPAHSATARGGATSCRFARGNVGWITSPRIFHCDRCVELEASLARTRQRKRRPDN